MSKFKLSFPLIIFVLFIIVLFCCFSGKSVMEGACSGSRPCDNLDEQQCNSSSTCRWST